MSKPGHKSEYTPKWKYPNWAQLAISSPRCHVTRKCYKVSGVNGEQVYSIWAVSENWKMLASEDTFQGRKTSRHVWIQS